MTLLTNLLDVTHSEDIGNGHCVPCQIATLSQPHVIHLIQDIVQAIFQKPHRLLVVHLLQPLAKDKECHSSAYVVVRPCKVLVHSSPLLEIRWIKGSVDVELCGQISKDSHTLGQGIAIVIVQDGQPLVSAHLQLELFRQVLL